MNQPNCFHINKTKHRKMNKKVRRQQEQTLIDEQV